MEDAACNEANQPQDKTTQDNKATTSFEEVIFPILEEVQNQDVGIQSVLTATMADDWDLGEGEFRWKGRSSVTGNPNSVTLDTSAHQMTWYLAEFTNLDNEYWANPMYKVELFKYNGGPSLGFICFDTVAIPDEDAGNEPTANDVRSRGSRSVTPEAGWFNVQQKVYWSYLNGSNGTCSNHIQFERHVAGSTI